MTRTTNIFSGIPEHIPASSELFETLLHAGNLRIERIVSNGHSTPEDEWYDQEENEWVILLEGKAGLCFEGDELPIVLTPGDYVYIPRHRKHRVAWTDADCKTVWLAIHYLLEDNDRV